MTKHAFPVNKISFKGSCYKKKSHLIPENLPTYDKNKHSTSRDDLKNAQSKTFSFMCN